MQYSIYIVDAIEEIANVSEHAIHWPPI